MVVRRRRRLLLRREGEGSPLGRAHSVARRCHWSGRVRCRRTTSGFYDVDGRIGMKFACACVWRGVE